MNFLMPWALLCMPLLWWLIARRARKGESVWQTLITDPSLREHLLAGGSSRQSTLSFWVAMHVFVLAMAQPVMLGISDSGLSSATSRVMIVDLSHSMNSDDLKPSRAVRVQYKLHDILSRMQGDRIGLIAFAAVPYVLAPPTDDAQTLAMMIDGIEPPLAPVDGSNLGAALTRGLQMLIDEGGEHGELVVLSDATEGTLSGGTDAIWQSADKAKSLGIPINTLSFASDALIEYPQVDGEALRQRFDPSLLSEIAKRSGGQYAASVIDDADLDQIWSRSRAGADPSDDISGLNLGPALACLGVLFLILGWRQWT